MKSIIKKKNNCELIITSNNNFMDELSLNPKTTICLMCFCDEFDKERVSQVVKKAIALKTKAFVIIGVHAGEVHDLIDEIIEVSLDEDLTHITTMVQNDDGPADIAWFFINSTYFDGGEYRCLALFDSQNLLWDNVQEELVSLLN